MVIHYQTRKIIRDRRRNHQQLIRHTTKSEITGLKDRDGNYLNTGDIIVVNNKYKGVCLFNPNINGYACYFGFWYPPFDMMNVQSYGKCVDIPQDNGMRMQIKRVGTIFEEFKGVIIK